MTQEAIREIQFESFARPSSRHRPAVFWSINDIITPEETAWQMEGLIKAGFSGGFFHSRSGLATEYLGSEWFASMRAALDVARRDDGYLWLYDEDTFPSGVAGGLVTANCPQCAQAMLHGHLVAPGQALPETPQGGTLAALYRLRRQGRELLDVQRIAPADAADHADAERLVVFAVLAPGRARWGGHPSPNLLHPDTTAEFLRLTHDAYARELGDGLGERIPGIFTDEPNIAHGPTSVPWYDGLPDLHRQWHDRDFWADLPWLFFEGPGARQARLMIQRTINRQFVEAFSKPIYDWCEAHGIGATGHYNAEDTLRSQLRDNAGGVMPHYLYQQIPGVDHLFRDNDKPLMAIKQATSAARQLGRNEVVCETFGGSRHTASFADFLYMGNFDLVMGVNLFCPHLTWYSATGRGKRDWPQTMSYQQTYWPDLPVLNDYFTRLCSILLTGRPVVDVLLLHPIDSAAADYRFGLAGGPGEDASGVDFLDTMLRRAIDGILGAGYDFDMGDETLMAELAAVEGDRLRIGQMTYRAIVVPLSRTWRPRTLALLEQFAANGGKLIFLGDLPTELDGQDAADAWRALARRAELLPGAGPNIRAALWRQVPQRWQLSSPQGEYPRQTLVHHRTDGQRELLFVFNNDRHRPQRYSLRLPGDLPGPLAVWDARDGKRSQARVRDGRYEFALPACGAVLLVAGPDVLDAADPSEEALACPAPAAVEPLGPVWEFQRDEPNVLVIDRLSVSTDGGKSWSDEGRDSALRRQVNEALGTDEARQYQPWIAIHQGMLTDAPEVHLRYRFHNTLSGRVPMAFVCERLGRATALRVNGQAVPLRDLGWQWDKQFQRVDITAQVRTGENVVEVSQPYDVLGQIEAAYVIGDFGVRMRPDHIEGELVAEPTRLHDGSWVDQGYPFYSGRMVYRTRVKGGSGRTWLRVPNGSATLYRVRVNGQEVAPILWAPYQTELSAAMTEGDNELEIELVSSRQNLLGPLHDIQGDDHRACGPHVFDQPWFNRAAFTLFDYGLLQGAEILRL